MKCRACMMGVPLAVALVALAWAVSVPVRGAKAMFAATNNVCAYNASAFSDPKGDGMQCADGALAVVSTSHALSSPIIYKEYQGQYNAVSRVGGESDVAACSATPIIYKECQGQDDAVFRTDGESVVATSSTTPIIYKECQGQDTAVFRTGGESVEVVSSTTAMINEGSQMQCQSSIVGDEDSLVVPRSVPVSTPSKCVVNEEGTSNCAFAPTSSMRLTPYQAPWISAAQPDSTAMQWFLRTYKQNGKPRKAYVSVATTGKTQLLVNGMNVSRNLFEPHRAQGDTSVVNIVYDVTPFLSRKANTISLWYCPTMPHVGRRQVAVSYWG
ncbi:alpha-L-rhamnosidase N-terminal domain-containing protein, partial [Prevotella conceptionensis]|uniref:alpha-L-rhamnosidase N-terminal domain-containing protein n=1 Tax=Prevotella conceptionensis TaxID=340486 RepID=UPI001E38C2F2